MTENFLSAQWENLIMANYAVSPDLLKNYLPKGLELDFYKNNTYVSLVGFMFKNTRLFNIPVPIWGTFEEINLRFYVKRIEGNTVKRGVVFINETVPSRMIAWVANKLYKEHYIALQTKNKIEITNHSKSIKYRWKLNKEWNHIEAYTDLKNDSMLPDSMEEFIFEHYYGYTKVNNQISQEYKVNHPRWQINKVKDYSIECNFKSMYGNEFSILSNQQPYSVIVAKGSAVSVKWKRTTF